MAFFLGPNYENGGPRASLEFEYDEVTGIILGFRWSNLSNRVMVLSVRHRLLRNLSRTVTIQPGESGSIVFPGTFQLSRIEKNYSVRGEWLA